MGKSSIFVTILAACGAPVTGPQPRCHLYTTINQQIKHNLKNNMEQNQTGSKSYLISIVMVAVLGGLLFGYDTGSP